MYKPLTFTLLTLLLAACGNLPAGGAPAVTPAPTETPVSPTVTFTPPPTRRVEPVETIPPTLEAVPIPATPLPTEPIPPVLTPDAYQVEHWQEYQTELAKVLLADYFLGDSVALALCEWDILGHSGQEVYVWAYCSPRDGGGSGRLPAIIYLKNDGAVQNVKVPGLGSTWASNMNKLFPADVREKLDLYYFVCAYCGRPEVLRLHLHYRREHPDELPLVVLSASPTP